MLKSISIKHNILAGASEVGWHFFLFSFQNFSLHTVPQRAIYPRRGSTTDTLPHGFYIRAPNHNSFFTTEEKRRQILLWSIINVSVLRKNIRHI